jgi:uncharacterized protein (TIGR03435 family)
MLKQLLCGISLLCALSAVGQTQQTAAAKPTFLLADVHDSPHRNFPFSNGGDIHGGRYVLRQSTIVDMIAKAYTVDPEMVQGGPSWLEMKRFDIAAKAGSNPLPTDLKLMLQSLLTDRFKLVMHKGDVPMPAYLVTVAGDKSKLKPAEDGEDHQDCKPGAPETAGGVPLIVLSCTGMTADEVVAFMHDAANSYFIKPAVNLTGLEGRWDFTIRWTGMGNKAKAGADAISPFDAMEKQLGLKVELKTAPRPVWIVDSVNEEPTPNSPEVAKELPEPPPAQFEVATIKPSKPDEKQMGRIANGQMNVTAMTLKFLITFAWDLNPNNPDMLVNAPSWLGESKFDVVAKMAAPEPVNGKTPQITLDDEEFHQMVRALLIERFNMKVRMEDRPIDAYTLMADRPKMKPADPESRTHCKEGPGPDGKDPRTTNPMMNMLITCQNVTPQQIGEEFAHFAAGYVYSPAKDGTGLKGTYDFTLNWSSADRTIFKPAPAPGASTDPDGSTTLYEASERQLGLKLVKEKRPTPVLVIEHIDEKPTEN